MRIIITGSPGTGKSSVARELSRAMGLGLFPIRDIVLKNGLLGKGAEVDLKKLAKALAFLADRRDFIVEGHLACEIRLPADKVIVLRASPAALRKRLARRKYARQKLEENIMAEMLDYCSQRAAKTYGMEPLELDTTRRTAPSSAKTIARAIKHNKKNLDSVDYSKDLVRFVTRSGSRREK